MKANPTKEQASRPGGALGQAEGASA